MVKPFIHAGSYLLIASFSLLLAGCEKGGDSSSTVPASQFFETNYLDKNYTVHLATDNGTDLTAQYNGYVFRLNKGNPLDGVMTATKAGTTSFGTWSVNNDYNKLSFSLPVGIPGFGFLSNDWEMTRKGVPILEMAAWNNDPKVLHFERQ
jgi:hypothetical protein